MNWKVMTMYKKIQHAKDLPDEWNELCKKNIYMGKNFLTFMEKVNYCNQSYHLFYKDNKLYSCFMMFERKFNLFIFTKMKFFCNIKFVYLPLSVSHPSIVFDDDTSEVTKVLNGMKGVKLLLNIAHENIDNFTKGHYLPICVLENRWNTFDEYLKDIRSSYRRRIKQALKKGENLQIEVLEDNNDFTQEMYDLYEQVFNNSEYFLEKLSLDFFRNDIAETILFKANGRIEAFVQLIDNKPEDMLIFEFVGYNYEKISDYDLYYNILIYITKYGIENGFKYIQYGQTAYDPKLRFGPQMYYNYFLVSHSNKFLNWLLKKNIHRLEYKVQEYNFNVFKEGKNSENNANKAQTS